MSSEALNSLIELAAATLTDAQLADERRATEHAIGFAVAAGLRPSEIEPHLDTIINRARALNFARAA